MRRFTFPFVFAFVFATFFSFSHTSAASPYHYVVTFLKYTDVFFEPVPPFIGTPTIEKKSVNYTIRVSVSDANGAAVEGLEAEFTGVGDDVILTSTFPGNYEVHYIANFENGVYKESVDTDAPGLLKLKGGKYKIAIKQNGQVVEKIPFSIPKLNLLSPKPGKLLTKSDITLKWKLKNFLPRPKIRYEVDLAPQEIGSFVVCPVSDYFVYLEKVKPRRQKSTFSAKVRMRDFGLGEDDSLKPKTLKDIAGGFNLTLLANMDFPTGNSRIVIGGTERISRWVVRESLSPDCRQDLERYAEEWWNG